MIEKLTEKGIVFKKIIYDKSIKEAQHGFMNNHHTTPAKECLQEVAAFIKSKVGFYILSIQEALPAGGAFMVSLNYSFIRICLTKYEAVRRSI